MSTALSDYLESGLLHHIFKGETFPKPLNVSIALTSGVPVDSDTGATLLELPTGINGSGTGYNRYDLGDPALSGDVSWVYSQEVHDFGSGIIDNSGTITFNKALLDWGWVSGIAIVDSEQIGVGNVLMHSQLQNPRFIYKGDGVKFDVQNLQIKLS